jgi:hypothetical protein
LPQSINITYINALSPSDKQLEAIRKEDRLIAAVNAYRSGQITSIRARSRLYRVGHETLCQRLNGTPARTDTPVLRHAMLPRTIAESHVNGYQGYAGSRDGYMDIEDI